MPITSMGAALFHAVILSRISDCSIDSRVDANSLNSSFSSVATAPRFLPLSTLAGMVPPKTYPDSHQCPEHRRSGDRLQRIAVRVLISSETRVPERQPRFGLHFRARVADPFDR